MKLSSVSGNELSHTTHAASRRVVRPTLSLANLARLTSASSLPARSDQTKCAAGLGSEFHFDGSIVMQPGRIRAARSEFSFECPDLRKE